MTEPPALTFTLREATELLASFGGDDTEITVRKLPRGAVKNEDGADDPDSPVGLWGHMTEYPEEGCFYLGPCEVQDEPVTPFEPSPASPRAPDAGAPRG